MYIPVKHDVPHDTIKIFALIFQAAILRLFFDLNNKI
jgi:hypothetical protein